MLQDIKNNIKNTTKLAILLRRSIYHVSFIVLLLILSFCLYYYGNLYKLKFKKNMDLLKQDKIIVNNRIKDIDNKIEIAQRFKSIWEQEIDKQSKNYDGVDDKYIDDIISRLSKANYLMDLTSDIIETSVYKKSQYDDSIKISVKNLKINFNCISEHSVYNFIDDFKKVFNGFIIVQNIEITPVKEIDKDFVKNMASGVLDYLMTANVTMYLYYIEK